MKIYQDDYVIEIGVEQVLCGGKNCIVTSGETHTVKLSADSVCTVSPENTDHV